MAGGRTGRGLLGSLGTLGRMAEGQQRAGLGPGDLQPASKYEDPGGRPVPAKLALAINRSIATTARKLFGFTDVLPGTRITPFLQFRVGEPNWDEGEIYEYLNFNVPSGKYLVVSWVSFHVFSWNSFVAVNDRVIEFGSTTPFTLIWGLRWDLIVDGAVTSPGQVSCTIVQSNGAVLVSHGGYYAVGVNVFDHLGWSAMNPGFIIAPGGRIATRSTQLADGVPGLSGSLAGSIVGGFVCPEDTVSSYIKAADGVWRE